MTKVLKIKFSRYLLLKFLGSQLRFLNVRLCIRYIIRSHEGFCLLNSERRHSMGISGTSAVARGDIELWLYQLGKSESVFQ